MSEQIKVKLDAIQERRRAITPGNWRPVTYPTHPGRVMTDHPFANPSMPPVVADDMSHDDARFMAFAPTDIDALIAALHTERRATADMLQALSDTFGNEWVHFDSMPTPIEPSAKVLYEWYKQFQQDMQRWIERERKARAS